MWVQVLSCWGIVFVDQVGFTALQPTTAFLSNGTLAFQGELGLQRLVLGLSLLT